MSGKEVSSAAKQIPPAELLSDFSNVNYVISTRATGPSSPAFSRNSASARDVTPH